MPAVQYQYAVKSAQQVVTLGDLYDRLVRDPALAFHTRTGMLSRLEREAASRGLSRNSVVTTVTGGVIGYLVAKYASMGRVGRTIAGLGGAMLGSAFGNRPQPGGVRGFNMI